MTSRLERAARPVCSAATDYHRGRRRLAAVVVTVLAFRSEVVARPNRRRAAAARFAGHLLSAGSDLIVNPSRSAAAGLATWFAVALPGSTSVAQR